MLLDCVDVGDSVGLSVYMLLLLNDAVGDKVWAHIGVLVTPP